MQLLDSCVLKNLWFLSCPITVRLSRGSSYSFNNAPTFFGITLQPTLCPFATGLEQTVLCADYVIRTNWATQIIEHWNLWRQKTKAWNALLLHEMRKILRDGDFCGSLLWSFSVALNSVDTLTCEAVLLTRKYGANKRWIPWLPLVELHRIGAVTTRRQNTFCNSEPWWCN